VCYRTRPVPWLVPLYSITILPSFQMKNAGTSSTISVFAASFAASDLSHSSPRGGDAHDTHNTTNDTSTCNIIVSGHTFSMDQRCDGDG
jgi:hypothetical protein